MISNEKLFTKTRKLSEKLSKKFDVKTAEQWGKCIKEVILVLRARNSQ